MYSPSVQEAGGTSSYIATQGCLGISRAVGGWNWRGRDLPCQRRRGGREDQRSRAYSRDLKRIHGEPRVRDARDGSVNSDRRRSGAFLSSRVKPSSARVCLAVALPHVVRTPCRRDLANRRCSPCGLRRTMRLVDAGTDIIPWQMLVVSRPSSSRAASVPAAVVLSCSREFVLRPRTVEMKASVRPKHRNGPLASRPRFDGSVFRVSRICR